MEPRYPGNEMIKTHRIIAQAVILVMCGSAPARAWNDHGHMTIAAAAYQQLTQETKDRADALLRLNPDRKNWLRSIPAGTSAAKTNMMIFMIASTWPDRIKDDPYYHSDGSGGGDRPPADGTADNNIGYSDLARHKYWHFIDRPFTQDGSALPEVPVPNAQTQITDFRAAIASTGSSDELKSYDLCWLLHLVGDVHQPLHCATRVSAETPDGDDGGNRVKLSGFDKNLHAFWDDVLGRGSLPATAISAADALPAAPADAGSDVNVQHWVDESFNAAISTVYMNPPIGDGKGPFNLSRSYIVAARKLARERAALAGARLAKILNNELK